MPRGNSLRDSNFGEAILPVGRLCLLQSGQKSCPALLLTHSPGRGDCDMAKVRPIPEGYHALTPHLVVRGAAQAIEFYKKAFGAVEVRRSPMPDGKTLMHA